MRREEESSSLESLDSISFYRGSNADIADPTSPCGISLSDTITIAESAESNNQQTALIQTICQQTALIFWHARKNDELETKYREAQQEIENLKKALKK